MRTVVTNLFHSFNAFGKSSKGRLFMMDIFKWAPAGFFHWMAGRNKSPGMMRLFENKTYTHEVAAKLIDEKRQELKDGTPRKDVLSLLGSSTLPFTDSLGMRCNSQWFSESKLHPATRFPIERRRGRRSSSVSISRSHFKSLTHLCRRTIMFAGYETTAATVRVSDNFGWGYI